MRPREQVIVTLGIWAIVLLVCSMGGSRR